MNQFPSALEYLPNLENLPLILAGPILRQTKADSVTVWLALKESRSLQLKIYETTNKGKKIGKTILQGRRDTIKLGQNLHIVAVTAKAQTELLQPDKIYAYNLYSDGESIIDRLDSDRHSISYFPHQLPTFALPPADLNDLKIVHGSCRKPHGGGRDALPFIDRMLLASANLPRERPHQLFLTGDQIYGDDVADPLLWLGQGINKLLLRWSEELPMMVDTMSADQLLPGKRTAIAEGEAGLTAMLHGKQEKAKSHLFSFGEYAAIYLLAWSPVLMSDRFPKGDNLFKDSKHSRHWQEEIDEIESLRGDLNQVRRGLANIPVYTICDDHDISDDWYLNREWCDRVLSKPLGKRVVQNGLLAYALFQAWGNTPEQFEPGTSGDKLLTLASRWLASQGQDLAAKAECDRYLGIPPTNESTGLPQFQQDRNVLILSRDREAIAWHYHLRSSNHEVIVLDTRTWRGYPPGEDQKIQPPMLLSPQAFQQQLETPLQQNQSAVEATIVILPTNLVALGIIDRVQQFELSRDRVFSSDVGDSWNFDPKAFTQLLLTLCQQRQRVIILSGDIHYSCAVRLTHWFHEPLQTSILVQLTSSAIKNSEPTTRLIHTKLKSLLPEPSERWLGWQEPFKLQKLTNSWGRKPHFKPKQPLPDWQYRTQWCKRQSAQSLPWQEVPQSNSETNLWQKLISSLISWLWRNRWLQEGSEVIGRNNLSLVKFQWSTTKMVIQETYWHPTWKDTGIVKSQYKISLALDPLPPLPKPFNYF
ncbi:MAG: PhoD-like phosphatase [Pleurocapsa sp. MO_226.B13]|nr:PhoD-like phosphatase [Pleurocapsa sp. MO_226.B13]